MKAYREGCASRTSSCLNLKRHEKRKIPIDESFRGP
jgi:hypothetical protein